MSQIIEIAKVNEYDCRAVPVIRDSHGQFVAGCSGPKCAHWEPMFWDKRDERFTPGDGTCECSHGRCGLSSR